MTLTAVDRQAIYLDPAIRNWVLLPIMVVMVLVGVLRHHATYLLQSTPKANLKQLRESASLMRARLLRSPSAADLPLSAFVSRKTFLIQAFEKGVYLKTPVVEGTPQNPMTEPGAMDPMMDMMKKNMAMIVPQTLIMSWITFFFTGFVLIRLPFPLTLRFKTMLQKDIQTSDMDVTWVSALSWYFLNLFGLRSIYTLILGDADSADGMQDMQQMQMGSPQPMQQPAEIAKMFESEKEYLDLAVHVWGIENADEILLRKFGKLPPLTTGSKKNN
ncbi:hypothetical protein BATDEDRAFT_25775 [Batrachochytrium dendrobatidis JAM81]|uniref:ER membrane protein complex subunit 3 n=2 Tax=Batrachochytrium dendrobatidis TaxID=109871 RepID=F4P5K6_BATDJ|nr:uncharacterized protein BATDEDRAFT_25775 [Batrachochytrium dendrobatidis JAM81]EGF79437.1 hypothetical protein BATDEDRAFT_25775 [Batrachochytrium dendrobatidis JAM81]KAJ8322709.1 hypothetical protein O5D80_008250 [Batrachochytrium dendrobatidis]KAK5666033.1 hypothetical protein QVD99_007646 [Batrachochytrium dendrobatidis]OAJ42912.1 hypothetical protein BDEG_26304 [Batrachochytrium dendrobatidis JEL423]|eukprot:XP_006679877.1 hypothetical protein BATDEDRAFT_25775 [Batrachochytrium dendrobatidis JAM81]